MAVLLAMVAHASAYLTRGMAVQRAGRRVESPPMYVSVALISYVILASMVGLWGQRKGYSFGIGFLMSLVLTFVVGSVTVFLLKDRQTGRRGIVTWMA